MIRKKPSLRSAAILILSLGMTFAARAQATRYLTDPVRTYASAQDLYLHGEYSLAEPIFRELRSQIRETDRTNHQFNTEEVDYYAIVCGLKLNQPEAREQADAFIQLGRSQALSQKMSYHLGEYLFRRQDMRNAIMSVARPLA